MLYTTCPLLCASASLTIDIHVDVVVRLELSVVFMVVLSTTVRTFQSRTSCYNGELLTTHTREDKRGAEWAI